MLSFLGQGHLYFKNYIDLKLGTCCTLKPSEAFVIHPRSNTSRNQSVEMGMGCTYTIDSPFTCGRLATSG
eukprot:6492057-Amphidinium_carterae.1